MVDGRIILSIHYSYDIYAIDVNVKLIILVTTCFVIYLLRELNDVELSNIASSSSLHLCDENNVDVYIRY